MTLKVHYDPESDVLYIAQPGDEEETIEVHPGVNLELDRNKNVIGIELLHASRIFKEVIEPIREKAKAG